MMKPKQSYKRYRKEEETRARDIGSHSFATPRSYEGSRVDVGMIKKRKDSESDVMNLKAAYYDLTQDYKKLQSKLAERQTINDELMTSKTSDGIKISELNKTACDLQKKLDEAKNNNTMMTELLQLNKEKLTRSITAKTKLIRQVAFLRRRVRVLRTQKETSEKSLQDISQKLKSSVLELCESHSLCDKIDFCPAIQYINTVPKNLTPSGATEKVTSDSAIPSKEMKNDYSTQIIEKHYSQNSLKTLVMNLENRHSDNYQLWRNVLWSLHKYGSEQGYDTLEIANCFSKRCSKKYKNLEDVRKTFESSNGTLSLHYLIEISKVYEEDLDAFSDYLSAKVPFKYLPLVIRRVDISDRRKFRLIVDCAEKSRVLFIIPELFVLIDEDGERLCFLSRSVSSKTSELASLCPHMKDGYTGKFNIKHYVFRARYKPSATVELFNPLKPAQSFIILPDGKEDKNQSHFAKIRMALRAKAIHLLWLKTKKVFGDEEDDSNIVVIPDEEPDGIRSDVELVEALFSANPSMKSRYCYSAKTIYYCSPSTNLWSKLSETKFESNLRKNLTTTLRLNKAELKSIGMTNTIVKMRNVSLGEIEDTNFSDSLDSTLNIFVTLNKTVDMTRVPPIIRDIVKDDMAERTCGWLYDRQLSEKHKEAVRSYFDRLFPQKSERKWFLSFVARLLSGRSMNGCFLVLTDNHENKNATSKLMSLLATVFGNYYIASNKIVLSKGGRDNPYDGGIDNLKGKRLLVADKLQKADVLNSAFIKAITDQTVHYVQDKKKCSRGQFQFPVVAGLIMTFTGNDVPHIDNNDRDFIKRMVTIPMRSQFKSRTEYDELVKKGKNMKDIYIVNDAAKYNFQEWSSAVLDLLIDNYSASFPT